MAVGGSYWFLRQGRVKRDIKKKKGKKKDKSENARGAAL